MDEHNLAVILVKEDHTRVCIRVTDVESIDECANGVVELGMQSGFIYRVVGTLDEVRQAIGWQVREQVA